MRYSLGLDIGGSKIKAACLSQAGALLDFRSIETSSDGTRWQHDILALKERIETELKEPAWRIGVAAPGLAARDGRSIACMPGRLEGLEGLDWTQFLNAAHAVPVFNDAHASLLGEVAFGAVAGLQDVIMLTLGTGVGGAILSGGKLLTGRMGRAGHLGHVTLDPDGPPDIVQTPGSLEDALGECTLARRSEGAYATTLALLEAARNGESGAREIWRRSVKALAAAIAGIVNILDPEAIVIGGGIALAGAELFDPLNEFLERFEWRPNGQRVRIVAAQLGEKAGALGAAHHASTRTSDALKHFFDY